MLKKKIFRFRIVLLVLASLALRNVKRLRSTKKPTGRHLLLIAHPDDESMFFAPTLLNLKGDLDVLCLSSGNKEGKGRIRKKEFEKAMRYSGSRLFLLNAFEDGEDWSPRFIYLNLIAYYSLRPFDVLMTFDSRGVSGHKNHISCYEGAEMFLRDTNVKGMFLESKNIFYKYVFDFSCHGTSYVTPVSMYTVPAKMILCHKSQLKFHMYLYILFSNFLTYNDFRSIN